MAGRYGTLLPAENASAHASGSSASISARAGASVLEPKSETLGSPPRGGWTSLEGTAAVGDPLISATRSGSAALCADAHRTKIIEKPSVTTRKWARIAIERESLVIFTMLPRSGQMLARQLDAGPRRLK